MKPFPKRTKTERQRRKNCNNLCFIIFRYNFTLIQDTCAAPTGSHGKEKASRCSGWPSWISSVSSHLLLFGCAMMMVPGGECLARLRLHRGLVYSRCAGHIGVEVGTGRHKVVLHLLRACTARPHFNAAGVN